MEIIRGLTIVAPKTYGAPSGTFMQNRNSLKYFTGTAIYLVSLWAMLPLLVRMTDYQSAGAFSLAIALCNLFFTISVSGMRSFQISDIKKQYTDQQYLLARLISITIGFAACLLFLAFMSYEKMHSIVIALFMVYKSFEAFSDLCYGYYQNHGSQFTNICISLTIKGIVQFLAFYLGLLIFGDLRHAVILMATSILVIIAVYDLPRIRMNVKPFLRLSKHNWERALNLFKRCSPMIVVLLAAPLMQAIPRMYFEDRFSIELFGIFSSVAAPVLIITVFIGSALVPYVPKFAEYVNSNNYKSLTKLLLAITGVALSLGGLSIIAAFYFGECITKA